MIRNIVGATFAIALPLLVWWLVSPAPSMMSPSNNQDVGALPGWFMIVVGGVMIVGIVFGHVHGALKNSNKTQSTPTLILSAIKEPGLYRSLLASPIVFGGVYSTTLHTVDPIIALIFAFQNGFFCESLLKKPSLGRH